MSNMIKKEQAAKYYLKNKEQIKQKAKEYYKKNKEERYKINQEYVKLHPEENKQYKKEWLERNPLYVLFSNCRARSKKSNYPFDLDFDYIKSLPKPLFCPVLGIPIDESDTEHKLSLDRLHPEKGYTKGNVFFISMKANRMKQDSTLEQLKLILDYMERNS